MDAYNLHLGEWFSIDQSEMQKEGGELIYLNLLRELGCIKIRDERGKERKIADHLSGVPFIKEDLIAYSVLTQLGWELLSQSDAERYGCRMFLDCNGNSVNPLFKKGNGGAMAIFDMDGIKIKVGKSFLVFSSELPF